MRQSIVKIWLPAIHGGSGVDVHTRRLALSLARHGVGADISWFSTYYQFAPWFLALVSPPPGANVVHALSWSGFAFKKSNIPLVVTEQLDVLDPIYRPYKSVAQAVFHKALVRNFMKKSFAAASTVTAVSRATAASLVHTVDLQAALVIPNFVDTEVFRPRNSPPKPSRSFKLLFVGNLTKRKGADLLAPIMKQLGSQFELRFTTGLRDGSVDDVPANMISIGKLNTDQELVAAYQDCDALLFPSRLEGLPIAPLEAMACAKPIIATRASSLPEVVDDGVTGTLCEPNKIDQFVAACQHLADSPNTLRQFGEAARQRVESLFSETIVVPQYISLYEKLIASKYS
jgi:glycosyltransferase involved in cell wall biosynthesis